MPSDASLMATKETYILSNGNQITIIAYIYYYFTSVPKVVDIPEAGQSAITYVVFTPG